MSCSALLVLLCLLLECVAALRVAEMWLVLGYWRLMVRGAPRIFPPPPPPCEPRYTNTLPRYFHPFHQTLSLTLKHGTLMHSPRTLRRSVGAYSLTLHHRTVKIKYNIAHKSIELTSVLTV